MMKRTMKLLLAVLLTQCCWAQKKFDSGDTEDRSPCLIRNFPIQLKGGSNVPELDRTCIARFEPSVKTLDLSDCMKVQNASRDFAQTMDAHKVLKQLHDQSEVDKQDPVRQFIQLGQCAGSDELESDYNNLNTALQELGTECKLVEVSPSEEVQTPVKGTFDWLKDVPSFLLTVVRTMVSYLLTSELIWYVVAFVAFPFSYTTTLWFVYIAWRIAWCFNWFGHKEHKAVSAKELQETDVRMHLFICHRILSAEDITKVKLAKTANHNKHNHFLSFTWTNSKYKIPTSQLFHMLQAGFHTVYTVYCVLLLLPQLYCLLYYVLPLIVNCLSTLVY
jgi:hypothetical protein